MAPDIRIGISGWRYPPWRGTFYPEGLRQRDELSFASRKLRTIEINGSFYSLQTPERYRSWHADTPADFIFAVKGSRFITHMKKLRDIETPLANFFASGILHLREKLGPILWQFPPRMIFDRGRFEQFFTLLPTDTDEAAALAKGHDRRVRSQRLSPPLERMPLRHAVEVRHKSFETPAFISLLRKFRVALVIADTAGRWPFMEDVTAGFLYLRLHGDKELYVSGYGDRALERWASKIRAWSTGREPRHARLVSKTMPPSRKKRDIFLYFDNDVKVRAPADAMKLARLLERRRE